MKIKTLIVAAFTLLSVNAFADNYSCTADNSTGIYSLTVDGGTAGLTAEGAVHTATGAGSEYMFDGTFAMGDVSFISNPTLYLPTDGSMSDITFHAVVADGAGDRVDMTCSH